MARIPMVTRTIDSTEVTIFCVNTEDKTTFTQSITMPGKYPDNNKLMKAIEKVFDGEPVKPISIEGASVKSALYGMTEYEFLKYAHVLPDRK